jgi:hypothetical protein
MPIRKIKEMENYISKDLTAIRSEWNWSRAGFFTGGLKCLGYVNTERVE